MKLKEVIKLFALAVLVVGMATSCVKEGPMGPAGIDGTDGVDGSDGQNGVDGKVSCLACHSGDNMLQKQSQFVLSGHKIGTWTLDHGTWSSGCVRCHTPVGFQQFAELGAGAVFASIENTETFDCSTCHGLHSTFEDTDYALRITTPVVPVQPVNGEMDLKGNSNLCGTCHQSRSLEPSLATPGETFRLSVRTGPHHGPQGNILFGNGLAEIAGSTAYPTKGTADHLTKTGGSCVGCHMTAYAAGTGGHSFKPGVGACNGCHEGDDITDFNYGGVQSDIESRLEELETKLMALGALVEVTDEEGVVSIAPADKKTVPMVQAQAVFNYFGVKEDRSMGVHNPKYVRAIMNNTLEALE